MLSKLIGLCHVLPIQDAVTSVELHPSLSPCADRFRWAVLIAFCLLSAIAGRWCYLFRPLDNDAAIFIYMGKMVSEGGRLCHDLIDNKFPTVGLMTSILWRAFGSSWPAYIALQTAMSFTGAWLLGKMAARHAGRMHSGRQRSSPSFIST